MDIIASHQHGLAEQLSIEARGLAGRPRDTVQRAQVYHHLFQHSGGRHGYALLSAEAALAIDGLVARMERSVARRWWLGPARADAIRGRVRAFGEALRELDRQRCEAMLMAYRLAFTPGLGAAADAELPADLLDALRGDDRRLAFLAHVRWVEERWGIELERAIAALDWPFGARVAARAIAALRLPVKRFERAERRGWEAAEQLILKSRALPAGFAANPGQAYYKLQRGLADKRRSERGEWADLPPDEAVSLAA